MLSKIFMGMLAVVLIGAIALSIYEIGKSAEQLFAEDKPKNVAVVDPVNSAIDTLPTQNAEVVASTTEVVDPVQEEAVQVPNIPAPVEQAKPVVYERKQILAPITKGNISPAWKSNSWGTTNAKVANLLSIKFNDRWAALSLFTNEFDLAKTKSLEIIFDQTSAEVAKTLNLAFYHGKTRIGGVDLARYTKPEGKYIVSRLPFQDMELIGGKITDVVLESEQRGIVSIASIKFSELSVPVVPRPLPQVPVEEVAISTPLPEPTQNQAPSIEPVIEVTPPTYQPSIYFAGLKNGWEIKTRNARIDVNNDERSVTGAAIKVAYLGAGNGAVSLIRNGGVDTSKGLKSLHIRVYGGVTDHQWQQLYVTLYDIDGNKLGTNDISAFSANGGIKMMTWNDYTLPLSAFAAEGKIIGTIDIENVNVTQDGDAMWFDDINFVESL